METTGFLFAASILSAAFGTFVLVRGLCAASRIRADAPLIYGEGIKTGSIAHLLRNGIPLFLPPAKVALKAVSVRTVFEEAESELAKRGYIASVETLVSLAFAACIAVVIAVTLISSSLLCGCAVALCGCLVTGAWLRTQREQRMCSLRDSVPDTLRTLEASFQSGLSLPQTLEQVADEVRSDLCGCFSKSAHVLQTGGSTAEALRCLRTDSGVSELAFVAVALDVQHQTGGSMKQVLASARDMAESELELARLLRVQTAQARLSARVVSVLPFVLIALFSLISDDFLTPFFSSAAGFALLALACGMQLAGIMAVRRILKVSGS